MAAKNTDLVKWPPAVTTRLTNLNNTRKACIAKRAKAFDTRDALDEEIRDTPKNEKAKLDGLKRDCYDVEREIVKLSKTIKWANNEIGETIDKAMEPGLFGEDTNPKPPADFEKKKAKEHGQGRLDGHEGDDIDDD